MAPSIVSSQSLNVDNSKSGVELISQEAAIEDIHTIINYVKSNPKEYKNAEQVVSQLENLLNKFKQGTLDEDSMNKIAKQFSEQSKGMENPKIGTKTVKNGKGAEYLVGFTKVTEVDSYDTLMTKTNPSSVIINIFEEGNFESGSYQVDKNFVQKVNDTLAFYKNAGFVIEGVVIEISTDGQQLSVDLRKSLKQNGYTPSNRGLSEIRNDQLKKILVDKTELESDMILQNMMWTDNGDVNADLRYNRIIIKVTKDQEDIKKEVKHNEITVYYKITDHKKKSVKNDRKPKAKIYNKTKGGGGTLKFKQNFDKCFFVN